MTLETMKPKPPDNLTSEDQRRRFLAAALESGANERDAEIVMRSAEEGLAAPEALQTASNCPKGNLGYEKPMPDE